MQKSVLIILSLFIFGGCATTNSLESDGGFISYGIDFRSYTNDDFLITTEKPNGDYKAVGLITVDQFKRLH